MTDPFAKVAIGDPVRFSAQAWNAMLDAAKGYLREQHSAVLNPLTTTRSATIIRVKNETGSPLVRGSILGLDGPLFTPADTSEDIFLREVIFRGTTPTADQHKRRYCVLLEPAGSGTVYGYDNGSQFARAFLSGVCPVKIDIKDISHEYANIDDGNSANLVSSRFGHARILWREGEGPYGHFPGSGYGEDTGVQWAIVMLGVTGSCFSVGVANGAISARSGSAPGSGQVDLYRSGSGSYSGATEDGPLETIDVLNDSQDTMTSGNGIDDGLRVSVAWDADDVAWVAPLECGT